MEETMNPNPIVEARRYVANAENVIKKAKYDPETKSYLDSKYIKMEADRQSKSTGRLLKSVTGGCCAL